MKKIAMVIEYFGKNYAGWQCQNNAESVQNVLENKLSMVLQKKIKIFASGRTDSGVHAYGQTAHFEYDGDILPEKIAYAVNTALPNDIRIVKAFYVPDDFHAQYSAKRKTYLYKYYVSRTLSPIRNETYGQISYPIERLNFEKMEDACRQLVGTHDFAGFSSTGSAKMTTVRTIYDAHLEKNGDEIFLYITGNGFLYNMVRIIAGTLAFVAVGLLSENAVNEVLITKDRKKAGKTFPAKGLYLFDVEYE